MVSDAEQRSLTDRLYQLVKAILLPTDDERFRLVEAHELTFGQVKALVHLTRHGEPVSGGALAESIGASAPVASRSLDALVQKGLADRSECSSDRRVRLFSATDAGAELAAELVALRKTQVSVFVSELPAEIATRLEDLLAEMADSGLLDDAICKEQR